MASAGRRMMACLAFLALAFAFLLFVASHAAPEGLPGYRSLYWYNYEYFKMNLCKKSSLHEPTFLIIFSSGAAAGSIAATLTLPFDVIKTHRQTELWELDITHAPQKKTRSIWEVMKRIVIENGFTGLFTGIIPRLTKIAPACAIMISTYEYGKTFFRRLNKDKAMKNY